MRSFSGSEEFDALKKTVISSYAKLFPVVKGTGGAPSHSLHLKRIWIEDESLDPQDYASQKKAKLAGSTWGAPLYAELELKDPEGKVIDQMAKIRLATIPKLTPRGSYIVQGNEYQIANQLRKKPGVYVHRRQVIDQFKADVSLRDGDQMSRFALDYDPLTQKFVVHLRQGEMPLYPFLLSLGATDDQMRAAWGTEAFSVNKVDPNKYIMRIAEKFARIKTDNKQTAIEGIITQAAKLKADPEVTKMTLGAAHDTLKPQMILDASKKLKAVYEGSQDPDDPENLLFKEVLSAEDMLHDLLNSQKQQKVLKDILGRSLGRKTKIKELINFRKLSAPVEAFFTRDDRSGTPEQTNPINMLAEKHKVTFMGTGGVTNEHAITNDMREVHSSHVGFIDPVHTPEGDKVGVTLHLTAGAVKDGRTIRTRAINVRTGKTELLSPQEAYQKVVAFPDEGTLKNGKVVFFDNDIRAHKHGKLGQYQPHQVDYILPTHAGLFSYSTNLIPFLHSDQGNRAAMAAKMLGQAVPLVDREAPLVQTDIGSGTTFHKAIGSEFSIYAPIAGKVTAVTKDHLMIDKTKVGLYNDFPLNQKTFITHEPKVKVGDIVKKGQLVADSNYTKDGTLALGKNLNVAYLPYPGLTFDDGIVITESAAKKLASHHLYPHHFLLEAKKSEANLNRFIANYPNIIPRSALSKYDSDGVIKKGSEVNPGEVLIAGMRYELITSENMFAKRINHKALMRPWSNAAVTYKAEFPGTVTDVQKSASGIDVYVKAVEVAKESDKLAGVHGNKGVITKVIPDHEAPRTKDGKIPDVFLNPHGVVGRVNLGQLYESAAGKIADKTKTTYVVKNFNNEVSNQKIDAELKSNGLSDTEEFFLPNGKSLGDVHVGRPYILRLAKTGKTGFSARSPRGGYDHNLLPTKGGEDGTKALDTLTFYSMLSHGAKHNLADAHQKAERNDEYWHALETGKALPPPKVSYVFEKFMSLLKGAGANTAVQNSRLFMFPLTDKAVSKLSQGKITEHNFFYAKNGKEIEGGYFDPKITGGKQGTNFAHIELGEPLPSPLFERPIKSLLGLNSYDFEELAHGKKTIEIDNKKLSGGQAIRTLLSKINVDDEIKKTQHAFDHTKNASKLDQLSKKLRYLDALKKTGLRPEDAYTRKLIPVIPPAHRPIIQIPGVGNSVTPANYLYQRVGVLNDFFTNKKDYPVMDLLSDEEKAPVREDLYKATRALTGLEPVTTRGSDHPIEGFVSQITGSQPKDGFFLSKIISKRQDLVGRAVITAGPDLHVDQLGIPEKMAWKIFDPFIVREYTSRGVGAAVARKEIADQTNRAKAMLEAVMSKRTVLMNRAPSLHKFSIMAFKPVLTTGLAIRVQPLVLKGFGGDFDGDAVTIHVPTSESALQESLKMLPSRNLIKPGTGELMILPSQESTIGIYFLSHTEAGRKLINQVLPAKYHVTSVLDQKQARELYSRISKEEPNNYASYVLKLKDLGDKTAYEMGFTVSIKDTFVDTKKRDIAFKRADEEVKKIKSLNISPAERDLKIAQTYQAAAEESYNAMQPDLKMKGNNFFHMVNSGARGKPSQLQQLIVAPGIVEDAKGRVVPVALKKSYAEGLKSSDYFVASYGARKGILDKSLQTSKPGAMNKVLLANTIDNIITTQDCKTTQGVSFPITSKELYDRYLSKDQSGLTKNTLVTPQLITTARKLGLTSLEVRSPLKCVAAKGTCAYCYGVDEQGNIAQLGDNVGAKCGQALSEPMTQMILRTFHTGGVAGAPGTTGFQRVEEIFRMPQGHVTGEAAQATVAGPVTKIEKSTGNTHIVYVNKTPHKIPPLRALKVRVGDRVQAGDALSEGHLKPHEVLNFKGMEAAQNYLVDELQNTYRGSDISIQRKVFETVVRSVGNQTRIVKAPAESGLKTGDVIPYTLAKSYNLERKATLPTSECRGHTLVRGIGKLPAHHLITDKDIAYLKDLGYTQVEVLTGPVVHKPFLQNIDHLTKNKKDWLAQIGFRYVGNSIADGAAEVWGSDLQGTHPIPAYAYGVTFGKKKEHY